MEFLSQIPGDWPLWLTVAILLIFGFRKELGLLVPKSIASSFKFLADRKVDKEEFEQQTQAEARAFKYTKEKQLLNAQLREVEIEREHSYVREEQLLNIVKDQNNLLRDLVLVQNKTLEDKLDKTRIELRALRRAVLRITDVIAFLYTQSLQGNGNKFVNLTNEIEEILGEADEPGHKPSIADNKETS